MIASLVLVASLGLSPGIALTAEPEGQRHASLVDDGQPSLESDAAEQVRAQRLTELRLLEENRPTLSGPMVMFGIAAGLAVEGVYGIVAGRSWSQTTGSDTLASINRISGYVMIGVGVAALVAVVVVTIVAVVKLRGRLNERREAAEQMDRLRRDLDSETRPTAPPQVSWSVPPSVVLASF